MDLLSHLDRDIAAVVLDLCRTLQAQGGRGLLVGGCVRDAMLGMAVKDVDIEVYGIPPARLRSLLQPRWPVDPVGEAFGVLKLRGLPIDVALPRTDSKQGLGHRGFEVFSDPQMPPEQACARRDFTINAMAWDPLTETHLDYCHGTRDLEQRILRHVSSRFVDDPLRVYRGMQFAARLQLSVADETLALCRTMTPEGLASERILDEWKKLILLGRQPSAGLRFLRDTDWIRHFPELQALIGCRQDPEWHPEGDVWIHTLLCLDAYASERTGDVWEDLVVGLAVLCHDFGKPSTTRFEDGRWRSRGHEEAGVVPTEIFLRRLTNQESLIDGVVPLVLNHLRPLELCRQKAGDGAIRRLAVRVGRIDRLVRVARADHQGRALPMGADFPEGQWLIDRAGELDVVSSTPKPVVMGRHLLKLGIAPGPSMGRVLAQCYEAQLAGRFNTLEDGLALAASLVGPPSGKA